MESKRIYKLSYDWIKLYMRDNKTNRIAIQYSNLDGNTINDLRKTIDIVLSKYANGIELALGRSKVIRGMGYNYSVPDIDNEQREELENRLSQIVNLQKANQTDRILIEYDKIDDRMMADDLRDSISLTLMTRKRETWHLISNSSQI